MRNPSAKAKSQHSISATTKLWCKHHLTFDQARYVSKAVRRALGIEPVKSRKRIVQRLSRDEEQRLIQQAYKARGECGLLINALFQTGARVSEFVSIKVGDFFYDETRFLIVKAKGGKSRYVPILPELAREFQLLLSKKGEVWIAVSSFFQLTSCCVWMLGTNQNL